jgi:hypothetical protein
MIETGLILFNFLLIVIIKLLFQSILLCVEIIEYIINIRKSFGKDDYDYEWEEQGRIFFVIFNSNYKSVMYIHGVQKGKDYRNFNDNYKKDKFFNTDESFPILIYLEKIINKEFQDYFRKKI